MQTSSKFQEIIQSPVLWGLFIAFVISIVKIVDPSIVSTPIYATVMTFITAVCGVLNIPIMFIANAAKRRAKFEKNF